MDSSEISSSSSSSYSTSDRSSSSGSNSSSCSSDTSTYSSSSTESFSSDSEEEEDNDASNAKQDRSINNKRRACNIARQKDDRISNLPNEIILHILSFLDMKYAVQTSAVSKRWKHIWTLMPNLNLNSRTFRTLPKFVKFVNDALSHRNHHLEVSTVELSFRGSATQFDEVVTRIVNYAYSRNVMKLTLVWFRFNNEVLKLPKHLFSCHTLKHLTLATNYMNGSGLSVPKSAWNFPALETLKLSNMDFGDYIEFKSLNLFSKCVNLKDFTLNGYDMWGLGIFNVCAPQLSNLTIIGPRRFPKVFSVVAPKLESLTASVMDTHYNFLQLSVEELDSLEKVKLSAQPVFNEKDKYAPGLLDLFQKLCGAKFLILDNDIIKVLSACRDQLLDEPCPFNNLKCLKIDKQNNCTATVPTHVKNYFLESSPTATFIKDLPQVPHKRSRKEIDKGTMAKKVPHKRPRREVDNGAMANTSEEVKRLTKTMDEEKRMLEAKISMQDKLIAEKKTMLEAMKVQHEKTMLEAMQVQHENKMLEAKIHMQDEIIAQQKNEKKAMLEATKLLHENGMLEEKLQKQDKMIAEQKAMLEIMKLQNEKKMFEEKIQRQDKIIAEQKAM